MIDRLMIGLEVGVAIGLVLLIYWGQNRFDTLNHNVTTALQQPTLTPTPLIVAAVLPKGDSLLPFAGERQANEIEMPGHLRSIVQSPIFLPIPTHAPEQGIRIRIPAIEVDAPIVQGDGIEQLKKGVAQHLGTPNPGQNGNLVLSAHNDAFGEYFRYLDRLHPGDEVTIYTSQHEFTYIITGTQFVAPTKVDVMDQTTQPTLTLISCFPYLIDNQRIVVSGILKVDE